MSRAKLFIAVFLASLFIVIGASLSATITVVAGDGTDLKKAVEVSVNAGDIIELPIGTYLVPSTITWPNKVNITLKAMSSGGANSTNVIISPLVANSYSFVSHNNAVGLTMENVTITGFGNSTQNGPVFSHGTLLTPRVELNNVIIKGNNGAYGGVSYYGTHTWTNCQIASNNATYGGATYYGTHMWTNCQIIRNKSSSGGVARQGTHTWTNCQIISNNATVGGVTYDGTHTWTNCQIVSNNASNYAGVSYSGTHIWRNCLINRNRATNYGGVACYGTHLWQNCVINSNTANNYGGVVANPTNFTLLNSTISMNDTTRDMFYDISTTYKITAYNSIFAGLLLSGGNYADNTYSNCLFSLPTSSYIATFSQSIVTDPQFINEQLEVSENALSWNAGSNSLWLSNSRNVTADYKGYPRVKNTIDIGAYELMRPEMSSTYIDTRSNRYQPTVAIAPVGILEGEPAISFYEWYVGKDPVGTTITKTGGTSIVPTMLRYDNYVRVRAVNSIGLRGLWKTVVKFFLIPYDMGVYYGSN